MSIDWIVLTIILSAVTYRVGRFIVLDTLIDGTRDKVYSVLEYREQDWEDLPSRRNIYWGKLRELLGCPWCITIWVAAFTVIAAEFFTSIPMPLFTWLAVATGSLVWWAIIDSED
jgi:hypothetical protein